MILVRELRFTCPRATKAIATTTAPTCSRAHALQQEKPTRLD